MTNRIIKFRCWDVENKYFLSLWEDMDYSFYMTKTGLDMYRDGSPTKDERYVFQMFTGLKDKNGKEIYEGDVVKCDPEPQRFDWDNPFEVKKSADGVSWNFGSHWFSWIYDIDTKKMSCEIIGNIYENSELLK